jgi:hypothetical protein
VFGVDDLSELTELVAEAWWSGADRDWSVPAGTLTWTCAATADHAIDTVLAPAFFLAGRRTDGYPDYDWGPFTMGDRATPVNLVDGLRAASRLLAAIVIASPADARAAIWRRPVVEARGPADFVPRGAMELALHGHDVCFGLGVPFEPPAGLAGRLRDHTADWPMWSVWGHGLVVTDDPWGDLLAGSGRARASSGEVP